MFKWKTAATVLAAASLIFAVGCGAKTEPSPAPAPASPSEAEGSAPEASKTYSIGISQFVEHPSLDATREGFLAALKDSGLEEGKNLKVDLALAQTDMTTNTTIAQKFAGDKKDLVLAIATPSAQAVAQAITDIPVVFTAVTDPLGAKLVSNLEKPGANVTGFSDTHPNEIEKLMEFITAQFPDIKTLGTVINEGEQNSVIMIDRAQEALGDSGVTIVKSAVTNSSEVKQAAEALVGRVDAIYIPKDNTVVSAFEAVVQVANENKLPLFVGDVDSVQRGGFATFGYQYYDIGYSTGKLAADILLNGKNAGDIAVGFPEQLDLYVNESAAAAQGIELTPAITDLLKDKEKHLIQ